MRRKGQVEEAQALQTLSIYVVKRMSILNTIGSMLAVCVVSPFDINQTTESVLGNYPIVFIIIIIVNIVWESLCTYICVWNIAPRFYIEGICGVWSQWGNTLSIFKTGCVISYCIQQLWLLYCGCVWILEGLKLCANKTTH